MNVTSYFIKNRAVNKKSTFELNTVINKLVRCQVKS